MWEWKSIGESLDSYQFNGMIQAASDDEDWEDMDIDPLSPPPKWIVLEKALRK